MFLEFNWTAGVYQPRFGQTFTDIDGQRSFDSLADAKAALLAKGLKLGKKTDSRSWEIITNA